MSGSQRFDWLFRPQMADEDLSLSAEARFAEARAGLPAVERSALALSEIGGLDPHEIAERLGTDAVVVRKLLRRARESVRTSSSLQSRRGLAVLLPFQNLFQTGFSGPVARTAGVIAAAIVAPSVAIGGAAADLPRVTAVTPDLPLVSSFDRGTGHVAPARHPARGVVAGAAPGHATRSGRAPAAAGERRSVRPGAGLQRDVDAPAVEQAEPPARRDLPPPARAPERPAPPPQPAAPAQTVARTVPRRVDPPLPAPPAVLPAQPAQPILPDVPVPVPAPEPPPLPRPEPPLP